jgi:L,D-transpeptidase ErfK/SrfK
MIKTKIKSIVYYHLALLLFKSASCLALSFPIPGGSNDVVGNITSGVVQQGDTFASIARRYDVGYCELEEANPGIKADAPDPGSVLIIPTQYVLPDIPKVGIVINLVEMRLYYFPPSKKEVYIFPVGIGREGWESPLGVWSIIERTPLPTWHAPESIREARAKEGVMIPKEVPPGPENPLGDYAMRLSNHTYLIHGTNDPSGVGRRSSAGCIRMYPEDIKRLFQMTKMGTPVRIINFPYKAGWNSNKLYLETHLPLAGILAELDPAHKDHEQVINKAVGRRGAAYVNWSKAEAVAKEQQAIPQEVGYEAAKKSNEPTLEDDWSD